MKPQNPGAPKPSSNRVYDSLLEPLPVPEVVESDSDTAWGLWQDSLQSPDSDETVKPPPADSGYDDTAPMDITDIDAKRETGL